MDSFSRAFTSTLHQKLIFIINGKMITIEGEEDVLVSQLSSFRYIEVGGKIYETSFQYFLITNVIMASFHNGESKTVIEVGHPKGWGRVLDPQVNKDKSGLGYRSRKMT